VRMRGNVCVFVWANDEVRVREIESVCVCGR
jgi:hypothetical protein